jgi:phosphatidate cytidylyltransferase
MKRVATAAVLIPLVLLAVYRAPFPVLVGMIGIVALLATHEYLSIIKGYGVVPIRSGAYGGIIVLFLLLAVLEKVHFIDFSVVVALATGLMLTLVVGMRRENLRDATLSAALSSLAVPYIGLTLLSLAIFGLALGSSYVLVMIFLAVWIGDTAAYYVGRTWGKHKLAPSVSPKKTWEGAIASAVFSALAVAAWAKVGISDSFFESHKDLGLFPRAVAAVHFSAALAFALGLLINIAAQLGDLAESMIKRGAGVKDSGTILPGHGGILDRIDALLFAAPVALLLFTLLDRYLPAR